MRAGAMVGVLCLGAGLVTAGCGYEAGGGDAGVIERAFELTGPGGWLEGMAHAGGYTGIVVPLPEAAIYAKNASTGVNSPTVLSDLYGAFHIPLANGSYRICWSKPGFTSACTTTIYTVTNNTRNAGPLALAPALPHKVRGTARLADGSPCLTIDKFMGTEIYGKAELLSSANVVQYSTKLNSSGDWVLPNPGTGFKVRVTCGLLTLEAQTSVMPASAPYKFTFRNHRPFIRPILAQSGGVEVLRGVAPGTVLALSSSAVDPEGHPMTFVWKATRGTLANTGTPNATWTVPATPGTYLAYLTANDGRGGYTTRTLKMKVSTDTTVRLFGNVRDDSGAVLAGATVQVGAVTVTTDGAGHFAMTVPKANRYLLNISKMGYAELSRPLRIPSNGQKYVLMKATAKPFNPAVGGTFVDDGRPQWLDPCLPQASCRRVGGRVTIPPNAVLLSPPPVGAMTLYLSTYDVNREPIPGDQTATSSSGATVALVSYGALFVELRDSVGTKYNLAPGKSATIEIPFQSAITAEGPPATMDMWKYDPATGKWTERSAVGTRVGNSYVLNVPSFSTQNADIEMTNPSCLFVEVSDELLQHDLSVRLQVPVSPGGAVRVYTIPLDELQSVIYNLPVGLPYTLELFENSNGTSVLKQVLTGVTGPSWGGVGEPPLTASCAIQTIKDTDLIDGNGASTRFLSRKGEGSEAQAQAYYNLIDPQLVPGEPSPRATLGGFWQVNGFDQLGASPDEQQAHFINHNDLGFGRDMHCLKSPEDAVACYVTNYGAADQAPGNYDLAEEANAANALATVAMEYSPGPSGGPKIVKFYAYAGGVASSGRITSANLDGAGEKYIPNLCLNCHGGYYQPGALDLGSSFREFDIYSYRDGTLGDTPNTLASGLYGITDLGGGQQLAFRALNELVRDTAPNPAISELVDIWYPNDNLPVFHPAAVPLGWRGAVTLDSATEDLYRKVVAKSCRTCHAALAGELAFSTYAQFKNARAYGLIPFNVCNGDPETAGFEDAKRLRAMPHASITFKNFWLDPAAYNTLGNFFGPGWETEINVNPSHECVP